MIQIESIRIQEFRGIRELTLSMGRRNFVVCGPNGSGKSGVVDAIQFALTGEIGRLKGAGTGDLSVMAHAPHVEVRGQPERASVELTVFIPQLGKTATIKRCVSQANRPLIQPDHEDVKAVFKELARRPEITLARRDIIKLILTEPTNRSRDVQTLLQLVDIDLARRVLRTTDNRLSAASSTAKAREAEAAESLRRHLGVAALKPETILGAVNPRRKTLGLEAIDTLTKDTRLSDGVLAQAPKDGHLTQGKESALADLRAAKERLAQAAAPEVDGALHQLVTGLEKLEEEPDLLIAIRKQEFLSTGLGFLDGPSCPLCDAAWEPEMLRKHLKAKLERAAEAERLEGQMREAAGVLATASQEVRAALEPVVRLPELEPSWAERTRAWAAELARFAKALGTTDGAIAERARLDAGGIVIPEGLDLALAAVDEKVRGRPERSAAVEATAFLAVAQERLADLQAAKRTAQVAEANAGRGRFAYRVYCEVSEETLRRLYEDVQEDFAGFYSAINQDDEREFKALLSASEGGLGLLVDFHKKGMFPPGAYHSEGHQDGMGVCLYLALLKRVFRHRFTLAVLDDVVMSVDSQHRRRFCKLLKSRFPNTQFVITTHDEVWARQMRSDGLVGAKSTAAFNAWSVETGPVTAEVEEVWAQIAADLAKRDVPAAAGRLRRHFEYVSRELAHLLGAPVPFKADGAYDMGQLLSAVIGRQSDLLKRAEKAARSWRQSETLARIEALKEKRTAMVAAQGGEQWAVNKAIHYNEWLNLTPEEFGEVVAAFRGLLEQFRCPQDGCGSWFFITTSTETSALRCECGAMQLNLREK